MNVLVYVWSQGSRAVCLCESQTFVLLGSDLLYPGQRESMAPFFFGVLSSWSKTNKCHPDHSGGKTGAPAVCM